MDIQKLMNNYRKHSEEIFQNIHRQQIKPQ